MNEINKTELSSLVNPNIGTDPNCDPASSMEYSFQPKNIKDEGQTMDEGTTEMKNKIGRSPTVTASGESYPLKQSR